MITEVLVFLPNEPGILLKLTKTLADNNIDIRGFAVCESGEITQMRLIVKNPQKASIALESIDLEPYLFEELIAVIVQDEIGSLADIAKCFSDFNVNIHHTYHGIGKESQALVAFHCNNPIKAEIELKKRNFKVLNSNEDII